MADHYETLGVGKEADPDAIKKAFRRKAAKHHPDRKGGDEEAFKAVQKAYEVLSDPQKRARYDLGAEEEPLGSAADQRERTAVSSLVGMFASILQAMTEPQLRTTDIKKVMVESIRNNRQMAVKQRQGALHTLKKLRTVRRRLTFGQPYFHHHINQLRRLQIQAYRAARENEKVMQLMLDMLKDFRYTFDPNRDEYSQFFKPSPFGSIFDVR